MKVGIVGVGAIGGSIAIKLAESGVEVFVNDVDAELLSLLSEKARVKRFDLAKDNVDVVIIATPMNVEERLLQEFPFTEVLIMDVASVKTPFVRIAESRKLRFVGGHPMAGSVYRKSMGWDPEIFQERPFFLCRTRYTDERDADVSEKIVRLIGASPVWVSPEYHDKAVSRVSHTTYFLSLVAKLLGSGFEDFAGPGFSSTTRLSRQNPEMVLDMLRYNRENILADLKNAEKILREFIRMIERNDFEEFLKRVEE